MQKLFAMIFIALVAAHAWSEPRHLSNKELGEYLEYDLEGSKRAIIRRELSYHTKQIIKAPFKATRWVSRRVVRGIRGAVVSVRGFFSESRSVSGRRADISRALDDWQSQLYYNDYHNLEGRDRQVSLLAIAGDSWFLLRRSLYTAGVILPRESWRTLKAGVYAAFNVLVDEN